MSEYLDKFKLDKAPDTAYYIPNFITEQEEKQLIRSVESCPKPKWTQLSNRRLQNWGGVPHPKGMIVEEIPKWLQVYVDKVNGIKVMDDKLANHVLINEYQSGQGILAHLDGPLFYPTIATISCDSHAVLVFRTDIESNSEEICRLLVEPRSLLVLKGHMYNTYLHEIEETTEDIITDSCVNLESCARKIHVGDRLVRDTRISLTIRHVPKTTKVKLRL